MKHKAELPGTAHLAVPADTELIARLEAQRGVYDGSAPKLDSLLDHVRSQTNLKEPNMLYRLFARRSPVLRLSIAAGLLACVALAAVLLPPVTVTPQGPQAAYPTAWAEQTGHVLMFDFGNVHEIPPGGMFHGEGQIMTLALAEAVLERLRAEVRFFRRTELIEAQLNVFEYRYELTNELYWNNIGADGRSKLQHSDKHSCFVAGIVLPDPALASKLSAFLKGIPLLPEPQLANSTWFVEKGLPDPVQPGVTIGLNVDKPQNVDFTQVPGYVPGTVPTFEQSMAASRLAMADYKTRFKVFNYPPGATEEQIEAQLKQWLEGDRPDYKYKVDVTLGTDRSAPGVVVDIVGRSDIDMQGQDVDLGYDPKKVLDLRKPADRAKMRSTEKGRARLKQMEADWRAAGQEPPWPTDEIEQDAAALAAQPPEPWSPPHINSVMYSPETRAELRATPEGRKWLRDLEQQLKVGGYPLPWADEGEVAQE